MATKQISLNTWDNTEQIVNCIQGEVNSRFLEITLLDNQTPIDLTNKNVLIYAKKPDGTAIFNECTIETAQSGIISICLTSQMSSCIGFIVNCEIRVVDTINESVLKFSGLKISVLPGVSEDAIESSSEFSMLNQSIDGYNGAVETLNTHMASTSNPHSVTYEQVGAAPLSHTHNLSDIAGTMSIAKGGTGADCASGAIANMGITATAAELSYLSGATSNIQTQLDSKVSANHTHSYNDLTNVLTAGNGIDIISNTVQTKTCTEQPTASIATVSYVSETITDVTVNPVFFDKLTRTTGEHTFSFIDYLWQYDGVAKDPNYYGITITGEPTLGDTITVNYTAGVSAASANKPAVIVETYKNQTEWYRLWSDGWLEQGGVITVPAHTSHVNCYCFFTKQYTNTDYQASGFIQSYISGWQCDDHAIVEKSIDKFKLRVNKTESGSISEYTFAWKAHGYI